ncbi:MAG: AbiV family abortive infection protein [Saprospiraceae bacterium]|nr:AbiV family abortive infection protein [Saprospiraceae bacterium]
MSEFLTISRDKCLSVYKGVIANAQKKTESADLLAEAGDFGSAMSFHIIGLEELIKAFFLFLDGKGFSFRQVKGMKGVFENHGLRYLFSFFLFVFSVIGESFGIGINYIRKINDERDYKKIRAIKSNPNKLLQEQIFPHLMDKLRFVIEELKWYKSFDKLRQNGLYSDFDGSLITPINIDEAYYLEFKVRVDRVTKTILSIIDEFNAEHPLTVKYLPKIVDRAEEKGFYDILTQFIAYTREQSAKDKKTSALELMSSKLNEFLESIEKDPPTFEKDQLPSQ